jgi:hypothetical protein
MSDFIMDKNKFKVNRSAFSVVSSKEQEMEERTYWHDKTPAQRLEALEITRQMVYGYNPATTRLQRVLEVVTRT